MATKEEIKKVLGKVFENKKIVCRCLATGMIINDIIEQGDFIVCNNCFEFIKNFQSVEDVDDYNLSGGSFARDVIDKILIIDSGKAEEIKKSYGI